MIRRELIKATVWIEWQYLHQSTFKQALRDNVLRFFENNDMKKYYVTECGEIAITSHTINSNNQLMVQIECECVIFEPRPGVLSMTVEDIDKKDHFVVLRHPSVSQFKVFVLDCQRQGLQVNDVVDVDIQTLKNRKNNIIAIGRC